MASNYIASQTLTELVQMPQGCAVWLEMYILADDGEHATWFHKEHFVEVIDLLFDAMKERVDAHLKSRGKRKGAKEKHTVPQIASGPTLRLSYCFKNHLANQHCLKSCGQSRLRGTQYNCMKIFHEKLVLYAYHLQGFQRAVSQMGQTLTDSVSDGAPTGNKRPTQGKILRGKVSSEQGTRQTSSSKQRDGDHPQCKQPPLGKTPSETESSEPGTSNYFSNAVPPGESSAQQQTLKNIVKKSSSKLSKSKKLRRRKSATSITSAVVEKVEPTSSRGNSHAQKNHTVLLDTEEDGSGKEALDSKAASLESTRWAASAAKASGDAPDHLAQRVEHNSTNSADLSLVSQSHGSQHSHDKKRWRDNGIACSSISVKLSGGLTPSSSPLNLTAVVRLRDIMENGSTDVICRARASKAAVRAQQGSTTTGGRTADVAIDEAKHTSLHDDPTDSREGSSIEAPSDWNRSRPHQPERRTRAGCREQDNNYIPARLAEKSEKVEEVKHSTLITERSHPVSNGIPARTTVKHTPETDPDASPVFSGKIHSCKVRLSRDETDIKQKVGVPQDDKAVPVDSDPGGNDVVLRGGKEGHARGRRPGLRKKLKLGLSSVGKESETNQSQGLVSGGSDSVGQHECRLSSVQNRSPLQLSEESRHHVQADDKEVNHSKGLHEEANVTGNKTNQLEQCFVRTDARSLQLEDTFDKRMSRANKLSRKFQAQRQKQVERTTKLEALARDMEDDSEEDVGNNFSVDSVTDTDSINKGAQVNVKKKVQTKVKCSVRPLRVEMNAERNAPGVKHSGESCEDIETGHFETIGKKQAKSRKLPQKSKTKRAAQKQNLERMFDFESDEMEEDFKSAPKHKLGVVLPVLKEGVSPTSSKSAVTKSLPALKSKRKSEKDPEEESDSRSLRTKKKSRLGVNVRSSKQNGEADHSPMKDRQGRQLRRKSPEDISPSTHWGDAEAGADEASSDADSVCIISEEMSVEELFSESIIQEQLSQTIFVKVEDEEADLLQLQLKAIKNISELTKDQLSYLISCSERYLKDIFSGKRSCRRHDDYKKGGPARAKLKWQVPVGLYTEDQCNQIMETLLGIFCSRHHKYLEYVMCVMMPETLVKIYMHVNQTDHGIAEDKMFEALQKPESVLL